MRIALLAVLALAAGSLAASTDTTEPLALSELALRPFESLRVALSQVEGRQAHGERVEGRRIQYLDLPPALQEAFSAAGIGERDFPAYVDGVETETDRRVAAGEREHLVYYALQSNRFTDRPRIEPAISARRFVEHLSQTERQRLLDDPWYLPGAGWPSAERTRISALLAALRLESTDPRLTYFRQLLQDAGNGFSPEALYPDYVRVARFLYRKEFVSGGTAPADAAQVARLYHERPHSSDTQIEAGFGVYLGLGTLRALDTTLRVTRVLVVGPGLDLAPRTDLTDIVAPQSYQPLAVMDALLALSLASERDVRVHSVDVNMRVVRALQAVAQRALTLHVFTGIVETADRPFRPEYRTYVRELGRAIGDQVAAPRAITSDSHYRHSIAVRPPITSAMSAERLNIITERLTDESPFDLIVATNVLTYFDDRQLALAMANMERMLRPGGYLLHNESRTGLVETAERIGLSLLHTRSTILGGPEERPLYDVIWLHQRKS